MVCFVLFCLRTKSRHQPETIPEATRRGQPRARAKRHQNSEPFDEKQRILPAQLARHHSPTLGTEGAGKCHEVLQEHTPENFIALDGKKLHSAYGIFYSGIHLEEKLLLQKVRIIGTLFEKMNACLLSLSQFMISPGIYFTQLSKKKERKERRKGWREKKGRMEGEKGKKEGRMEGKNGERKKERGT